MFLILKLLIVQVQARDQQQVKAHQPSRSCMRAQLLE